ncbi:MAG: hypothetical protein HY554_08805 [Elusimicrobia bacterium]|nr:hypothetical protein [Elusimicrobiota bacterium]
MTARSLLVIACLAAFARAEPAPPPAAPDPAAAVRKLKRGSAEETAAFEKHRLRSRRKSKAGGGLGVSSFGPPAAPAPAPPPDPGEVVIAYELEADAEVSLSILTPAGTQLLQQTLSPGMAGGRKGANRLPWDGRDASGRPAPPGEYLAVLSILYHRDGEAPPEPATRMIPVVVRKSP